MSKINCPENAVDVQVLARLRLGRPNGGRSCNTLQDVSRHMRIRNGDQAPHRVCHNLYEGMPN